MTREHAESGEIVFGFGELFFSRTDAHGMIQFGNSVFQRVSVYEWDELLGKPHKIVRHPDTPRAVFRALWDTIKQGAPVGAYVKNRAKDGRFYWVFAVVTPIQGGYLSVRLRPSSALLPMVKQIYAEVTAAERGSACTPAESLALLGQKLSPLGFTEYASFMAAALGAELAARDAHLRVLKDPAIARFQQLAVAARTLLEQAAKISTAYLANDNVPFNFRVLASQLGPEGAAIGVISSNYSMLSNEMKSLLDQFVSSAEGVSRTIDQGFFLSCTARIQREMLSNFIAERAVNDRSGDQETELLEVQQREYAERAVAGLRDIVKKAEGFRVACEDMNRLAAGLEVTRIMGKVECSRHILVKDRLGELLSNLENFQKTVAAALKEIDVGNQRVKIEAAGLLGYSGGGATLAPRALA